jgi:hypothetical protein
VAMQLSSHDKGQVDNFRFVWITHESVRSDLSRVALLVLLGNAVMSIVLATILYFYISKMNKNWLCVQFSNCTRAQTLRK